jgi:hypothetical protein
MRYSFISPWLFVIAVANLSDFMKVRNKVDVSNFKIIACIMGFTTIISGIYLANEVYAKEEATYKSGLLLANRVADHLESIEGYVPGETKVFIVGNLRYNYAPVREEFSFVRDFTNIGSPIWDTAITQYWSLMGFLDNQIAIDVNYAVTPPFEYEYYAEGYADILSGGGYEFDRNDFICKYEVTDSFPSYDCYFWCGDILVFKLSERK